MLGMKRVKSTDEQIQADLMKARDEALLKSQKLEKLIKNDLSGWKEFDELVVNYIDACKKRKAITAIDRADEKTILELRLLDHEIFILTFMRNIPAQYIGQTNQMLKDQKEAEQGEEHGQND